MLPFLYYDTTQKHMHIPLHAIESKGESFDKKEKDIMKKKTW